MAILASGSAVGYGVAFAATPLLTRIYSPEEFGALAVYMSVVGMLGNVVTLRYPLAIPLPEDDDSALSLLLLSLGIAFIISLILFIAQFFWGEEIVRAAGIEAIASYLWLVPVGLLGIGTYQSLNYWAVRTSDFGPISQTKIIQSVGMVIIQLTFGFFNPGAFGLIVGDVFGRVGGSGSLAVRAFARQRQSIHRMTFNDLIKSAIRYRRFPMISASSSLLNSAGLQIAPLLLASFYGVKVAGLFALSQRIIGIPMVLFGQAIGQVFYGEFAKKKYEGQVVMRGLYLGMAKKLAIYGAIPVLVLGLWGPDVFGLIFGNAWRDAGIYTQTLAAMFLIQFVVVPLSQTLTILEKQVVQFIWDALRLLLVIAALYGASFLKLSPLTAILLYGISMFLSYAMLFLLSLKVIETTGAQG
ncbi:lipopolysaccharide biosynthesis protein [Geothermobacter hydrogeniphilus]|uniref:lipopolysaccharide biosynthesis protein n=1 Tax=Geothermobacter hydrogeniphilus TaxID=1969733 RepID=UPI0013049CB3|nr:oligosaccharide flippase family protein [Geothermobacter hydrogeniphilus]